MASLVTYSDSSSDGEGDDVESAEEKDGGCDGAGASGRGRDEQSPPAKKACVENSPSPVDSAHDPAHFLPLPPFILGMFSEEGEDEGDVTEHHQGRVRSFPHVRGNWATFVSIPVPYTRDLDNCITAYHEPLQRILDPLAPPGGNPPSFIAMPLDSLHVSFSRTVAIRHHWIEPLTHMLGERLGGKKRFTLGFSSLAFYSNDEKTTSFLGVKISKSHDQLCSMVRDVDECFAQYKLQQFHKNPSFHMSIYWCTGDVLPRITDRHMAELQECWEALVSEHNLAASLESMEVTDVRLKSGNRWFSFPLSDT